MKNLNEASAFAKKSPYDIYQEWEGIPVYKDFIVPDLLKLELGDWDRTGGNAAFVNMDGAGGTCDTLVEEIPPGGQLKPVRHMYEKAVFIRSEEHTSELQSLTNLVCRLLLEKKKKKNTKKTIEAAQTANAN